MEKAKKSKTWENIKGFILFSAITHLILLAIYSIIKGDITLLNYFNVIDIDLFFPNISKGTYNQIFAAISMIGIFFIIRFINSRRKSVDN
ncbi:MAG: hypothetical protein JXL97_11525 [Bacteroidales bacterium]|nr:hypothetical protein [Bacteroidales bacterium]